MLAIRTVAGGVLAVALFVSPAVNVAPPADALAAAAPAQGGRGTGQAPLPPALLGCPELAAALRGVAANDARLRDWPGLARYREANRTVGPVDVVFMGDSITDVWPQERFGPFFPGRRYVGRGISAQTTPQMLIRMRSDVLSLRPKVVVILAGTNDIAGNTGPMTDEAIQGNLTSMSDLAAAAGVKVVLSSILPTSNYHAGPSGMPQTTIRPLARVRAINDWMRRFAADRGHVYLDYFAAMLDAAGMMRAELTNDDLHPNAAGYAIMAPLAEAAIKRALE
jgi:lysophospholipase L1-like esterase